MRVHTGSQAPATHVLRIEWRDQPRQRNEPRRVMRVSMERIYTVKCSAVQCSAVMHRHTRAHAHTHARCIRSRCVATLSHRCTSDESATPTRQSRTKQVSACRSTVHAACRMLHVALSMLHAACGMLHAACSMLHVLQVRSCAAAPQS